jgi:hypothetical protein
MNSAYRQLRRKEAQRLHAERLATAHCQFHAHFTQHCYDCRRRARLNNLSVAEGDPGTDLPGHERPMSDHDKALRGDFHDVHTMQEL